MREYSYYVKTPQLAGDIQVANLFDYFESIQTPHELGKLWQPQPRRFPQDGCDCKGTPPKMANQFRPKFIPGINWTPSNPASTQADPAR